MRVSATEHWQRQLDDWKLPERLLSAVPDSPYTWPESLWKRRAASAIERGEITPTTARVEALAGAGGSVLDVGAGTGRASLPLARLGHPITAVERSGSMLSGLRDLSAGLPVEVIEGSWPEVAPIVGSHSVAMCAHVVYDVREIGPFLSALSEGASSGVVIELTETHPWTHLGSYYQALHGLTRPGGPSADDLAAVVAEVLGISAVLERWTRPPDLWFESRAEIIELYARRLVLPRSRWPELDRLLDSEIIEKDGRYLFGTDPRQFVTLWWARS